MAGGQVKVTVTGNHTLYFEWWLVSQNAAGKTSTIGWRMWVAADAYGAFSYSGSHAYSVKVNGNEYTGTNNWSVAKNSTKDLASGQTTIYHESYGKTTFSFSFSQTFGFTWGNQYRGTYTGTGSGELTLEQPYGASTFTVDKTSVKMGEKLIFSIQRDSAEFKHKLSYWNGVTEKWVGLAENVDTSYSWTVPDLTDIMPNAVAGNLWLLCETLNGTSNIGSKQTQMELTVYDPATPSVANNEVTMGTSKIITCTRKSTNFSVELSFVFGSKTFPVTDGKMDSYSWTPSYDLAKEIPNLTYGTGTLKCVTYHGTAKVGEKTVTVKAIVPENSTTKPKFAQSDLTLSVVTDLTGDLAELYIRGKTGLKAEFSATSDYSTIKTCSVTAGSVGASGNPAVIDLLVNEGNVRVTAKVTDARGFSSSVTAEIHVLPYQKPKVTPYSGYGGIVCERAKATGELSSDGTYLAIMAGKSFSSFVVNGVERNACELRYRYKTADAAEFGNWVTLLSKTDSRTEVSMLIGGVVPSTFTSYTVELEAIDSLGGMHELFFQIMTERISMVLFDGEDGVGFGKYPEEAHVVDIAAHMKLIVRGKMIVAGADWVSLPLLDPVSESPYDYGRAEGCQYLVSNGNHVFAAFNASFVHQGTPLTVNASPIPAEYRPARPVCGVCPTDSGTAVVEVGTDGYIRVRSSTAPVVLWIDGYLDYFT